MVQEIIRHIEATQKDQFALLEELVLQTSHTLDPEGVNKVGEIITRSLHDCNLSQQIITVKDRGNNLVFSSQCCKSGIPQILLVGHMDTVFPASSDFNFYREDDTRCYGPGIIDMKGGLVTAIYVLKTLSHFNILDKIPITLICNSDEEMGSLYSADLISEHAQKSFCGFVFECGGLKGEVVTGRKGKNGFTLDVKGKAGHAAFTGRNGKSSAILELAHKTIALEKLNDPTKQLVVNVGKVNGGAAANIVAENASAAIDIRFVTAADGSECVTRINQITEKSTIAGTTGKLTPTNQRSPMEQTDGNIALFSIIKEQAEKLGYMLDHELRSGVSDANTLAACGIPVVDGLGPIGDLDHSENEYMEKNSLQQRCQLATLSILQCWEKNKKTN